MMKRIIKSVISAVVFAVCAMVVLSAIESAYGEKEFTAGTYTDYYYLTLSETEKKAYTAVRQSILSFPEKIDVPVMNKTQLEAVLNALIYDDPMIFMLDNCSLEIKGKRAYFVPKYTLTKAEYESQAKSVNEIVTLIQKDIPSESFEAELYCHDYIINRCTYSDTGHADENTVAGVLINGRAKCSGYAKAFKLLLNSAGIESVLVTGNATDYSGKTQKHMWNAVKIGGTWCYTDTTWNDPVSDDGKSYIQHIYFNMTEDMLSRTHTDFDFRYECNNPDIYYYIIYKAYFTKPDSDMITSLSQLIANAAKEGRQSVEFMLSSEAVTNDTLDYLFEREKIYRALETAALSSDLPIVTDSLSYTADTNTNLITIFFDIKD